MFVYELPELFGLNVSKQVVASNDPLLFVEGISLWLQSVKSNRIVWDNFLRRILKMHECHCSFLWYQTWCRSFKCFQVLVVCSCLATEKWYNATQDTENDKITLVDGSSEQDPAKTNFGSAEGRNIWACWRKFTVKDKQV